MKFDTEAYKITVLAAEGVATILCVTYRLSPNTPHYAAEFFELVRSIKRDRIAIPNGAHTYSFVEEMRINGTGVISTPEHRADIKNWFVVTMKEVYGNDCKVQVENFPITNS